ncbi:ATP-binding cassette domain-containing protein [Achromobacter sp. F4_2707]|uniref:iron ABC transporter ATP-binding protein n=1 Tax=Achromobacter sp. F4_2707 TaxID=3114286 RepID=UPI0039C65963
MIEVSNVSKTYGDTVVVDNVSVTLPRGGVLSIIGPNGAGKSTLLSMIARLTPMSAGSVVVDGMDVTTTLTSELAKRLAILRQDNHIAARLTVYDLVSFGRFPYSKGRLTPEDVSHIEQAIVHLDLQDYAGRFLDELSGGQRQRAFVAMVLCQGTDYTLFDEPLNNLDVRHATGMMKILRQAARHLGKTVVIVLHDINFASTYSDRIIAMKNGRVHRQGTPEEIIRADVLEEIYCTPFEVHHIGGKRIVTYYD